MGPFGIVACPPAQEDYHFVSEAGHQLPDCGEVSQLPSLPVPAQNRGQAVAKQAGTVSENPLIEDLGRPKSPCLDLRLPAP